MENLKARAEAYWRDVERTGMGYEFSPQTLVVRAFIDGATAQAATQVSHTASKTDLLQEELRQAKRRTKQLRQELAEALQALAKYQSQ